MVTSIDIAIEVIGVAQLEETLMEVIEVDQLEETNIGGHSGGPAQRDK